MPKLRIAMLTTFYPPYNFGGDGIGVQRLATALAGRGCEVTVIHDCDAYLTLAGAEPPAANRDPRIEVVGLKSALGAGSALLTHQLGRPVMHAPRLRRMLDSGGFDVIWYHNVSLIGGPGLFAYGRGLKLYEAHEHWLVCPTHVLWRFNREPCDERHCLRCVLTYRRPPQLWRYMGTLERELQHVDAFIAKSEFSRDMHTSFGFPRDMTVIPYFLADGEAADAGDAPDDEPYFLYVGRLEKIKGVQDILPAFDGARGPKLLVVGSGEHESELRRQAEGKPRVRFVGRLAVEALRRYYRHAIGLIVPTLGYETFGIILIEAFRHGTPVIARRIGPFPEIVRRGGGVLFASRGELGEALEQLQIGEVRARLGREARAAFEQHWREDVVVDQYFDLMRRTAQSKGAARIVSALAS